MKNNNIKIKYNNIFYIYVLDYIITIIFAYCIIYYLNNLKSCKCFQDKNSENYSNIDYLIILEAIIIAINVLSIIIQLMLIYFINNYIGGANTNRYFIMNIIILVLYFYFIYNVYILYKNIDNNCLCTQSWLRYLLYIQTFIIIIFIIIRIIFIIYSFRNIFL